MVQVQRLHRQLYNLNTAPEEILRQKSDKVFLFFFKKKNYCVLSIVHICCASREMNNK